MRLWSEVLEQLCAEAVVGEVLGAVGSDTVDLTAVDCCSVPVTLRLRGVIIRNRCITTRGRERKRAKPNRRNVTVLGEKNLKRVQNLAANNSLIIISLRPVVETNLSLTIFGEKKNRNVHPFCCAERGSSSKKDSFRLDKLIRQAGSVVSMKLDSLVTVAEKRSLDKLLDIMNDAKSPSAHCHHQPEKLVQ